MVVTQGNTPRTSSARAGSGADTRTREDRSGLVARTAGKTSRIMVGDAHQAVHRCSTSIDRDVSALKDSVNTRVAPGTSVVIRPQMAPPLWKNGRALNQRSRA